MRIVSGKFGGIRLEGVKGDKTRPTTDKVKESLFSMLGAYFDGGNFLDLYAGSGAVGLEAISRGMDTAVLVDRQYQAIKTIKDNVTKLHAEEQVRVIKGTAEKVLIDLSSEGQRFDMVFLDPPYKLQKMVTVMEQMQRLNLLAEGAIVICETDNETELPDQFASFTKTKQKEYGLTRLNFYRFEVE
ncbi:16S rRNA (guanine(966)-N(2))-methyltransferase RsmD [Lentilactobacillus senioris]|uniref:16S rRNA (guanine(966)-N(2))-methyltransferase RsmD n=1 Tax=Lentilactobacillus senioris TaxID=931534 RepID=UPI00228132AC|nr:16S rRNA (guanine(966)-N(2))-methyltransferase RsmD [Lentilactobacillus senioris]MCY9807515.1 16S rRNA (guanine(966)-N(2))-methyltransferase RsmD [Lentilactobacillus senioris]